MLLSTSLPKWWVSQQPYDHSSSAALLLLTKARSLLLKEAQQIVLRESRNDSDNMCVVWTLLYLNEGIIPKRVDVQVEAKPKETGEQSAHQHSKAQIVAQRQALAKYPAAESKNQALGSKHTTGGDTMWADTHRHTHKPDKHANGVGYQEAVIQCTKQCLVIVLVWREHKDAMV